MRSIFEKMRDNYPHASWALWNDDTWFNPKAADWHKKMAVSRISAVFEDNLSRLNPSVVFVGSSRSKDTPLLTNYHFTTSPGNKILAKLFAGNRLPRLDGAYMTDWCAEIIPQENGASQLSFGSTFFDELRDLDQPKYDVLCFGNKVFDALCRYLHVSDFEHYPLSIKSTHYDLKDFSMNLFRVYHFAAQVKSTTKAGQLLYINNLG